MSNFTLSQRSIQRMAGIHPDLFKVVQRAIQITEVDFAITEGLRDIETQARYVAGGKSKTMNSRHLTGHAVDVVALIDGKASWQMADYAKIAQAFNRAAYELGIPIVWGGDWTFKDGPHFELSRDRYPAQPSQAQLSGQSGSSHRE